MILVTICLYVCEAQFNVHSVNFHISIILSFIGVIIVCANKEKDKKKTEPRTDFENTNFFFDVNLHFYTI